MVNVFVISREFCLNIAFVNLFPPILSRMGKCEMATKKLSQGRKTRFQKAS